MQDERTLAATITLRAGETAWLWKIAYNEAARRASPGVQLTLDVTESILADTTVARVDSCATADHPMIDHLWRERLALTDLLIAPSAGWYVAMLTVLFLVMAVELLNTAVEKLADHITPEWNAQIGIVKDMGSAAVFATLCAAGLTWIVALLVRVDML